LAGASNESGVVDDYNFGACRPVITK